MAPRAVVYVWIGSEWLPLRGALEAFLAESRPESGGSQIVVISSSRADNNPADRVSRWIERHLSGGGAEVTTVQPGDRFVLRPAGKPTLIGVTELLLDPDPRQVEQFYALSIWSRFVPRRRRLRMYLTPYLAEEIVQNAETADPILTAQIAEWRGQRVLIVSTDLIAAEVAGRALRSVAQPAGDIGLNPWQTDLVRIASERSLGARTGPQITLQVQPVGPMPPPVAAAFQDVVGAVGQLVDCQVALGD